MPGPFPGMDPYLEHPAWFPGLHQGIITYATEVLNTILPPHYAANIGERLYVVQPDRAIYPDLAVLERPPAPAQNERGSGGVAVAVAGDPPWVLVVDSAEMREVFIEIVSLRHARRVVTVVEVL